MDIQHTSDRQRSQQLQDIQPFWRKSPWSYAIAIFTVGFMSAVIHITHADANEVNIPPLYLLAVQAVAVLSGSGPAVLAALSAFLAFNWFFIQPRYQLTVSNPFEFVSLCVFLVTAILVGQLTALFRTRALEAHNRELAAKALAQASWTVASDLNRDSALKKVLQQLAYVQIVENASTLIRSTVDSYQIAVTYNRHGTIATQPATFEQAVKFVLDTRQTIGWDDSPHWDKALASYDAPHAIYLPISAEGDMLGMLFLQVTHGQRLLPEDRQIISSLVNHITVVLQRDRLVEAQAMVHGLAQANKLKTALLQMVSHDFRSPLSSIKASVSSLLLEQGEPIDKGTERGLLQAIEQEADRLNKMVGNLLDLSRLESNAWQTQREAVLLSDLIGSVLDAFNARDNARIEISIPTGHIELSIDFVQMAQVLKNLLENALKYSPAGSKVVLHAELDEAGLLINITDCGPGLPTGEEHRIFEPFYRAKEHAESAQPGVGMGLAICKNLVEANEGNLTAYNRESGGAVFCIRFMHNTVVSNENSGN